MVLKHCSVALAEISIFQGMEVGHLSYLQPQPRQGYPQTSAQPLELCPALHTGPRHWPPSRRGTDPAQRGTNAKGPASANLIDKTNFLLQRIGCPCARHLPRSIQLCNDLMAKSELDEEIAQARGHSVAEVLYPQMRSMSTSRLCQQLLNSHWRRATRLSKSKFIGNWNSDARLYLPCLSHLYEGPK